MHEYSIVQALLERVDDEVKRHGGTARVHKVRVSIGELAGVEVALLKTAYETIRHHTICHDADLDVRAVQAQWVCRRCEGPVPHGTGLRCTQCGQPARLVHGDEIMLDQIEMEAAHV
jgi:hydrogenase nickel incorporation protein HypA/HybF